MKINILFLVATVIVTTVTMVGCNARQSKPYASTVVEAAQNFRYFHDPRTHLCFTASAQADLGSPTSHIQVTWVPCTPDVLKVIGIDKP